MGSSERHRGAGVTWGTANTSESVYFDGVSTTSQNPSCCAPVASRDGYPVVGRDGRAGEPDVGTRSTRGQVRISGGPFWMGDSHGDGQAAEHPERGVAPVGDPQVAEHGDAGETDRERREQHARLSVSEVRGAEEGGDAHEGRDREGGDGESDDEAAER